jgi:hypothetical protein
MKKTMMNYEAPVAEMIELQASMVLMNSGGSGGGSDQPSFGPSSTPGDPGGFNPSGGGDF